MLPDDIKSAIQVGYSQFLKSKGLQPRYGQRLMIAEVAKALGAIENDEEGTRASDNHVCVVEAGTGTGKTVAYLLAAIPVAQALGKKLVISTATVALQEQIVDKDIPDLLRNSPMRFSYQLAKGRGRYLCRLELEKLLQGGGADDPTMALWEELNAVTVDQDASELYRAMQRALAKQEWFGDRDQWPDEVRNEDWARVTTDQHRCLGRNCDHYEQCAFYEARNDMHRTDLVVANHDLVLADLALGGGAILPAPADTIYIFDEGHHLPDKALKHFSAHGQLRSTLVWLDELNKVCSGLVKSFPTAPNLAASEARIAAVVDDLKVALTTLLNTVLPLAESEDNAVNDNGRIVVRFPDGVIPDEIQSQAQELRQLSQDVFTRVDDINSWLNEIIDEKIDGYAKEDAQNWSPLTAAYASRLEGLCDLWVKFSKPDDDIPVARWLNFWDSSQGVDVELAASPILASQVLSYYLWSRCYAAVVTSATLMAMGTFERFRMRSGTPEKSTYHEVPSPFDYPNHSEIVVPKMDFDPSDVYRHTEFVLDYLLRHGGEGALLVLFTSRRQLEEVTERLPDDFAQRVLAQGELSKAEILFRHRNRIDEGKPSIIFGLASFAEGIDLPGDYCTHVVIAKLPFAVPEDPVDATLAEWIKAKGGNPFMQITVPDAAIRLKQAVGRLIRTERDTGVISVLDRRLVERRYGGAIIKSLPPIPVRRV